jgi:hypothetical protein
MKFPLSSGVACGVSTPEMTPVATKAWIRWHLMSGNKWKDVEVPKDLLGWLTALRERIGA